MEDQPCALRPSFSPHRGAKETGPRDLSKLETNALLNVLLLHDGIVRKLGQTPHRLHSFSDSRASAHAPPLSAKVVVNACAQMRPR